MLKRLMYFIFGESDQSETSSTSPSENELAKRVALKFRSKSNKEIIDTLKVNFISEYCERSEMFLDDELVRYFIKYTTDVHSVLDFYYKSLGIDKEKYNSGDWRTSHHYRLDMFSEEEYGLLLSIALIEIHKSEAEPSQRAELRHFVLKRLMLELLLVFDVFCQDLTEKLLKSNISIPVAHGSHFSVAKNIFFKEKYKEEFSEYHGITKNMIVDTFLSQVSESLTHSDLSVILKVLFSWKIPMVSSFAGFQDGNLPSVPTVFNNEVIIRQTQHLSAFLACRVDDYRCSPKAVVKDVNENYVNHLRDLQVYTPRVFSDPELKTGVNCEKMFEN